MDEYKDPLMPEDVARWFLASEQNLYLRYQAWEAKIREVRTALDAVASEILRQLPERTRAQYSLEVWFERLPTYRQWYNVALIDWPHFDYMWRTRVFTPFGQHSGDVQVIAPKALKGHVPPEQAAIEFRSHYGAKAWSHEVVPYQGSFMMAENTNTGVSIFSGLTARTVALRVWQGAIGLAMGDQPLTGD